MSELTCMPPVRGLMSLRDRKGRSYSLLTLQRWLRLNRSAYDTFKIDVIAIEDDIDTFCALSDEAGACDIRLSMRAKSVSSGTALKLAQKRALDVFLCPESDDVSDIAQSLTACSDANLPVRLQLQAPFGDDFDAESFAGAILKYDVPVVNIALFDGFARNKGSGDSKTVEKMNALASCLSANVAEINLIGLPLCLVDKANLPYAINSAQFHRHHQHYHRFSYDLAKLVYRRSPGIAAMIVRILLARYTSAPNPIDNKLFPWLVYHPWFNLRVGTIRSLTRGMRFLPGSRSVESPALLYDRALAKARLEASQQMDARCRDCSLRRICDHDTAGFRAVLPGVQVQAQAGDAIIDPMSFCKERHTHFDDVDDVRANIEDSRQDLAEKARRIVECEQPTKEIGATQYSVDGGWGLDMPGALGWYSVTNTEKMSTVLARVSAPFTISASFGGGIADYIGFSLGRHCKIVCPMVEFAHTLVLHVAEDGSFVLLRDGKPVAPVSFDGLNHVPLRLGNSLEPRLSVWNIDMQIQTQAVMLWEGADEQQHAGLKYSIIVVSVRFARRLQATLRSIAHQKDFDLAKLEVIVAYVPGIDATGDVLDGLNLSCPDLRVVRSTFSVKNAASKGFMINESARLASGEWVVLLDSDIVLGPKTFAELDSVSRDCKFAAPDGRIMLSPETTAAILMNDIEPWNDWDKVVEESKAGAVRDCDGTPIGFFQAVKRECLEQVPYDELEHFAGADSRFGEEIEAKFGEAVRLKGLPVLHLDHSGSQWYGTKRHR